MNTDSVGVDEYAGRVEAVEAVLSMTVFRLGGEVEGKPTNRGNFLGRIDALVSLERGFQRICDVAAANLVRAEKAEEREILLREALQRNVRDADRRDRESDILVRIMRTTAVDALRTPE